MIKNPKFDKNIAIISNSNISFYDYQDFKKKEILFVSFIDYKFS